MPRCGAGLHHAELHLPHEIEGELPLASTLTRAYDGVVGDCVLLHPCLAHSIEEANGLAIRVAALARLVAGVA